MQRFLVSCLAITATSLTTMAQDAPRRGNRPQGDRPAQRGDQPGERGGQPGDRGGQPGERGPRGLQLSPEKAKAAWELEAKGVAGRLGLNDDQTGAVVKAYAEARTSHNTAAQKLRESMRNRDEGDEGGDRRARLQEMQKSMEDLNKTEREKLVKALTDSIGADNASKAAASLGLFAPNWDRLADSIGEMKLEAAKQQKALDAVESFIVSQSKIARDADPEDRMAAARDGREKLLASLKDVLSAEELAKFEQSIGGGRGRGRGGEGGGRPNRGGGDGGF